MNLISYVLIAISVVGAMGLPLGDPKFLPVGVALEASFIGLAILSLKKVRYAVMPSIAIACVVIAGNTLSPTHTDIMRTLTPLYNATILMIGGYVLQILLIITSLHTLKSAKPFMKDKVDYLS